MLDFLTIAARPLKSGGVEIYPSFKLYPKSQDLMIRGKDFYAVWIEDRNLWSTDELDALQLIDLELDDYAREYRQNHPGTNVKVLYARNAESGTINAWHQFCQKQLRDSYVILDENLIFANTETTKEDYASKKLNYPLEEGDAPGYDKLISTLYSEEERHKLEWAIGSIVSGDSKYIQKFLVLYGSAGTGKSTILNIVQQLFEGYYSVFDAKSLGSSSHQFALEAFKTNPLVAIQHDGDLSKIEDNTRLNSLVSHELMTVNEKFKGQYTSQFKCFLFMGTNKPVKITDAKSGLIRRLIDVTPSGNKLDPREYKSIMNRIPFELGAIAKHCLEVYLDNPGAYDNYIPMSMMGASNDFYNFVLDSYHIFKSEDGTTRKAAWEMYKNYCDEAKVPYPLNLRTFTEELKNYFYDYTDRFNCEDGSRVRSYYSGFRTDRFEFDVPVVHKIEEFKPKLMTLDSEDSIFDRERYDCLAQYASSNETPTKKWDEVTTTLSDLDTRKLHYVKVPENHIVIDFDLKDESGNKSLAKNLEAASKWPATYAELSKSGQGVHLHYIYTGDATKLSGTYDQNIEIKVFKGLTSLRRKLTKCNNLPIATISSGLPLKGEDKLVNFDAIRSEYGLRKMIIRNLNKEIHASTKSSIDFINEILTGAYNSDLKYDVSDMYNAVFEFAANSTNQSEYCMKLVTKMPFKSEEPSEAVLSSGEDPLVFYDVEVFPNLFIVNWKIEGEGKPVVRMINPGPSDIEPLLRMKLVGFNCRRYDNHMLYARLMGYTNEQLFNASQKIINNEPDCFFGEAYNISYTDIYDFSATKQSLKKWEIELGIHHQELGLPWDKPVPEELWVKVAEYCDNDVIATEAVFNHLQADWTGRQILSDLAEMSVNDTTNSLTTRIIFGKDRKPQSQFNYRDLSKPVYEIDEETREFLNRAAPEMMAQTHGEKKSLLPYFEDYKFDHGVSTYRGEEVGEGGYVYAEPGMHGHVALLDIASMHPHSTIAEVLFGVKFTTAFKEIVDGRVSIKHKAWEDVNNMLEGKLTKYIQKVIDGEITNTQLANALKIAINSVYGLTSAKFDNPFRDPRNKDNIVAKRGALFMIDLKHAVQEQGYTVAHIKTDSIKIPDATPEIIQFVMDFGKKYGYTFEHEDTYEKMCLVNNAVYVAKYKKPHLDKETGKEEWWTATGTQFQVPYVFKRLFSKEDIEFNDMCETKSVTSALYLDMNEGLPDVTFYEDLKLARGKNESQLTKKEQRMLDEYRHLSDEELDKKIEEGHAYAFVGKVGQFCPIKEGGNGGILCREKDGKFNAATGTKGYRWLESEMVKVLGKEDQIDRSYYDKLVDDAVDTMGAYGDVAQFLSDDPWPELPFKYDIK